LYPYKEELINQLERKDQ
jgi:nuclear GTP-binding protein